MAWQIIFSARGRSDLEQIIRYIARDDPAAAERFGAKLIEQAERLGNAPDMGPRLAQKPNNRFFPVGSYLIIYRPDAERRVVRIFAILARCAPGPTGALRTQIHERAGREHAVSLNSPALFFARLRWAAHLCER